MKFKDGASAVFTVIGIISFGLQLYEIEKEVQRDRLEEAADKWQRETEARLAEMRMYGVLNRITKAAMADAYIAAKNVITNEAWDSDNRFMRRNAIVICENIDKEIADL